MPRKKIRYRTIYRENDIKLWLPEQLIIRVWKWCNFRCIFCNVAENESVLSLKSSIREILAITFYKLKYSTVLSNHINITISWWEPSIFQKETIFILKYFTKYFRDRSIHTAFDLQSNASNIDTLFAQRLRSFELYKHLYLHMLMIQKFFRILSVWNIRLCDQNLNMELLLCLLPRYPLLLIRLLIRLI